MFDTKMNSINVSVLSDIFTRFSNGVNEKTYKQAFSNVAAFLLLSVCFTAAYGVYIILQPFLKPLLWALLCGFVLYPCKRSLSNQLQKWMHNLDKQTLFPTIGCVFLLPLACLDTMSESIGRKIQQEKYPLLVSGLVVVLAYFLPQFCISTIYYIYRIMSSYATTMLFIFNNPIIMISFFMGFVILLFKLKTQDKLPLKIASFVMWIALFSYIAGLFAMLNVPVFIALQLLFSIGILKALRCNETDGSKSEDESADISIEPVKNEEQSSENVLSSTPVEGIDISRNKRIKLKKQISRISRIEFLNTDQMSDQYISWVFYACIFMLFIKFSWILHVTLLLTCLFIFKKLCLIFGIDDVTKFWAVRGYRILVSSFDPDVVDVIFPRPIKEMYKILLWCKSYFLGYLKEGTDTISTIIVIVVVILLVSIASVYLTIQVYTEGMYLIKVSGKMINDSVVFGQEYGNLVPDEWNNHVHSAINNIYSYGREMISKMFKKMTEGLTEDKTIELERTILELWDRMYQAWVVNSVDTSTGPKVSSDVVYQAWDRFTDHAQKMPELTNMSTIMQLVNNNMSMLSTGLKSVWDFTLDNIGLVLSVLETFISVIFSSGFALLSFFIDIVVFLSALFYLLAASKDEYKPVEVITNISPIYGNRLAAAVENAVREVFTVSLKLSVFYGLYTWLVHNLFQMHIVYVPTVLASLLAAVPILPAYCVSLPGILDLWLIRGELMEAILLFVLLFIPTNIVDVTIYQEIHGGHPYVTGLSMAGGVICFGIEGAIIGPLILCCMFVVINLCTSLLHEPINI